MRPLARGAQTPKNSIIERFDIENSHLRRGLDVLCSKTSLKHQLTQRMKNPMVVLRVAMSHFKHCVLIRYLDTIGKYLLQLLKIDDESHF